MRACHFSFVMAGILAAAFWAHATPLPPVLSEFMVDDESIQAELQFQTYEPKKVYDARRQNLKFESELANTDARDAVRQVCFAKIYQIRLSRGKSYVIDMVSTRIDSYLRLEDSKGTQLAQDDDSGGNLNARIRFSPAEDGTYRIIATSCRQNDMGPYTLTINQPNITQGKNKALNLNKVHTLPKGGLQFNHQLTNADPKDTGRPNSYSKVYQIKLVKGKSYTIDMVSNQLDSYLRLEDAAGRQLAEDDDSGGGFNARIRFTATQDGAYSIIATTFIPQTTGPFTLSVRED